MEITYNMNPNEAKNLKIKEAGDATREKRKLQICKVIELKIDEKHLNKKEKEQLKMFFVEAKWLYNHILNQQNVFLHNYKTNPIQKKNKDGKFEDVVLKYLPPACRQGLTQLIHQNIKSLSGLKHIGKKAGKLRFTSDCKSISLSQYGTSHYISGKNKFKIIGIKRHLKVHGLQQITEDMEFANAKLLNKPDGYYIKLTTFQFPNGEPILRNKKEAVGLDFGIKDNIVTSDGEIFNVSIAETDRLKRFSRKLEKSKKGSNNRYKLIKKIQIEYQKLSNKKKDASNKIVNKILTIYHQVIIQDEQLHGWQSSKMKGWGRRIQHSCMGSIKAKLRDSKQTTMLGRFVPTTKMCHECGTIQETLALDQRVFSCISCGYTEDRDIKAAKTILKLGLIQIGGVPIEFKPAEKHRATLNRRVPYCHVSLRQEARVSR